jgi:hypothetical protein
MSLTLLDALRLVEDLKLRMAVWTQIYGDLGKYVGAEAISPSYGIKVEGCVSQIVPAKVVENIRELILAHEISPLKDEIETLEGMKVEETDGYQKSEKEKTRIVQKPKGQISRKPNLREKAVARLLSNPGPKDESSDEGSDDDLQQSDGTVAVG